MRIRLQSRPKINDGLRPRSVPPIETYQRLRTLMPEVGITHLAEISSWDQLDLPISLAFGPLEEGIDLSVFAGRMFPGSEMLLAGINSIEHFPDLNGSREKKPVFSAGKGLTPIDARVSAMMEAVERASASTVGQLSSLASYRQMKMGPSPVLDPRLLILINPDQFSEDQEIEWVEGYDIMMDRPVWVPTEAATLAYHPAGGSRTFSDTPTGLGAGNTIEEAVSHGLAEAIEHDAWSLALARSALNSAETGLAAAFTDNGLHSGEKHSSADECSRMVFTRIALDSLMGIPILADMIRRIKDSGYQLVVHEITSDIRIPVFSVTIGGLTENEDGGGLGAHPDARIALARAFTEAAQQRLVQAVLRVISKSPPLPHWTQPTWERSDRLDGNMTVLPFKHIPSTQNLDILADIKTMLNALKERGYRQVAVVDLTNEEWGIPVVKVIVPGFADYWTSRKPIQWKTFISRIEQFNSL